MASSSLILALLASLASGLAFWFGTGLEPAWWATWLAPFPVFLVAPRLPVRVAFASALAAGVIGGLNMWTFLAVLPLIVRIVFIVLPAVAFALGSACHSALARRGHTWSAAMAPAAVVTTFEYAYASVSPHGTYGSLAYTQAEFLPVLQLVALGGLWPVVFLLMLLPALVAGAFSPTLARTSRFRMVVACTCLAAAVLGWGSLRLRPQAGDSTVTIGLAASDLPENQPFRDPNAAIGILNAYLATVPEMAAAGVNLVLMPEHLLTMREAPPLQNAANVDESLHACADANDVGIAIGVDRVDTEGRTWNEVRVYRPRMPGVLAYQKQHLLPGLESFCTPGHDFVTSEALRIRMGFAICKDLDFPSIGRAYGRRSIDLLLVPAFDFVADAWLHSRMAVVRGVESGFAVVRSARGGTMTLSDNRGRILAETRSDADAYSTLVATIQPQHIDTLYARLGDWFGWLASATGVYVACRAFAGGTSLRLKQGARPRPATPAR